jgi:hypothetical protein
MSARAAFRVGLLAKMLAPHMEADAASRLKLYKRYGNEDGSGTITVPEEHMAEFRREVESMLSEKVSVNVKPLKLDDIADVTSMSGEELMALGPIIVE